ncbi:MAG TPA: hypothetical protein H9684_11820 [Firmicutes bacterium]|nr:hypothetical protein [Bacillota bacterium]
MMKYIKPALAALPAAITAACLLTGCAGTDSPAGSRGEEGAPQADTQIVDYVQAAMEAGDRLTSSTYFLAEDGAVLTCKEDSWGGFAADAAAVADKKKLAVSASGMTVFTLTQNGDLYYRKEKVAEGVAEIVYATTNVNEEGRFIAGDKVYRVACTDAGNVNASLRESAPENYVDVDGGKTVTRFPWNTNFLNLSAKKGEPVSGSLAGIGVDKHDFFVLNQEGRVFLEGGSGTDYTGMDCFGWKDMAVIGAAKYREEPSLTVAGIQRDGTVLACGDYAEEVLGWGPLAGLSLSDGMIVGLTRDGSLKMTGQYAEFMAAEVESWTDIAAVKVGNTSKIQAIVNAIGADGTLYHLEYDPHWTELAVGILDPAAGSAENGARWYRYAPDGTVSRTNDSGGWEPYEADYPAIELSEKELGEI